MRKHWENPVPEVRCASRVPVPPSFQVGGVRIAPATVLAPMAGVTDTVFRRFIRNLGGCGLMMTEFTSADGILAKGSQGRALPDFLRRRASHLRPAFWEQSQRNVRGSQNRGGSRLRPG